VRTTINAKISGLQIKHTWVLKAALSGKDTKYIKIQWCIYVCMALGSITCTM